MPANATMSATRVEAKPRSANASRAPSKRRSRVGPLARFTGRGICRSGRGVCRSVLALVAAFVSRAFTVISQRLLFSIDDDIDVSI